MRRGIIEYAVLAVVLAVIVAACFHAIVLGEF